jgi:hypothetical protein
MQRHWILVALAFVLMTIAGPPAKRNSFRFFL